MPIDARPRDASRYARNLVGTIAQAGGSASSLLTSSGRLLYNPSNGCIVARRSLHRGSCSGPREIELWPADVITRVPVAFATQAEAMEAGETAADALWINVNRQLAEG